MAFPGEFRDRIVESYGDNPYSSEALKIRKSLFFQASFSAVNSQFIETTKDKFIVMLRSATQTQGIFAILNVNVPPTAALGTGDCLIPVGGNPLLNNHRIVGMRFYPGYEWMCRWNREQLQVQTYPKPDERVMVALNTLSQFVNVRSSALVYGATYDAYPFGLRISTPDSSSESGGHSSTIVKLPENERAVASAVTFAHLLESTQGGNALTVEPLNYYDTLIQKIPPPQWVK